MSEEVAEKSLDLVFKSPSKFLKIEFQGGEPLLNFELIKKIVFSATKRADQANKNITFVIATNLALIDDTILSFVKSTILKYLHLLMDQKRFTIKIDLDPAVIATKERFKEYEKHKISSARIMYQHL